VAEPAPPAPPEQPPPAPEPESQLVHSLTGHFFMVSLRRAFRLQIHTDEVLEQEREALAKSAAHVVDPEQQAFLAWRRSVLLIVAIMFVPLTVLRFMEAFDGPTMSRNARIAVMLPAFFEALFCLTAFWMLSRWTQWVSQRRILFFAWALYFIAPYIVYLYPFQEAFDSTKAMRLAAEVGDLQLKANRKQIHLAVGLVFGVKSMLVLAPKAVSLMPGIIRASIVTKLLFPGTSAPGYLMVLAAPLYALFAYIVILLPYQITASLYFVAGVIGVTIAQVFITTAGMKLTMPLAFWESRIRVHKYWLAYILILVCSALLIVMGAADFVTKLDFGAVSVISTAISFLANVLVLTLIGTDTIVANLHRLSRRTIDPAQEALRQESNAKLERFCG
jgi:hypothetical protein